jgi:hypothetical protein
MSKEIQRIPASDVTIEGTADGRTSEKRFYLSGVVLKTRCPTCKKEIERDFGDRYLSYPYYGTPFDLDVWCDNCSEPNGKYDPTYNGAIVKVQLNCSLTVVDD